MTNTTKNSIPEVKVIEEIETETEPLEEFSYVPPVEYKHDAAKAPIIIEEEFDIEINLPDE